MPRGAISSNTGKDETMRRYTLPFDPAALGISFRLEYARAVQRDEAYRERVTRV